MAQQQQGGSGGGDNSMAPVWITVLLFLALYFIWKMGSKYIVAVVFKLNLLQAKVVTLFVTSPKLANDIYLMQTMDPATVGWKQFLALTESVGDYTRYPVMLVLVVLAIYLYQSNITLKFINLNV